jgi:ankyrin repeat protein
MSDSKELSVLRVASQRLIDSDDETIEKFCHSAADVSAFEDALQHCNTERCRKEAAASSLSAAPVQETVYKAMKTLLWHLLTDVLTRNERANAFNQLSWSVNGYSMVARIAKSILSSWCIDKRWIDHANRCGDHHTALTYASKNGHTSVAELLLADPRVDKASIDHTNRQGESALMIAAQRGHTSIVELLLADPRVDKASVNRTDRSGHTALWYAASHAHLSVSKLLISDGRTSWDSIVEQTADRGVMNDDEISPLLIAELTRRQMCVIYPSANRLLWPAPVQSDAESGDAKSSGPAESDDDARGGSDGIAEPGPEPECALITSFFKSDLLDVNALRIIREYATYTRLHGSHLSSWTNLASSENMPLSLSLESGSNCKYDYYSGWIRI